MRLVHLPVVLAVVLLACGPTRRGGGDSTPDEICDDGIDNDEDGTVDEGEDDDNDGFLDCGVEDLDCDDQDADIHPGAGEVCDGVDNDCDGVIDEDFPDGCGDDDDAADDDDTPGDPVLIVELDPAPLTDNHIYTQPLWVEFDRAPDSVELSVAGVAGATEVDGPTATFQPASPLEPNTSYAWTISFSPSPNSPVEVEFATGPYGELVGSPNDIVGRTYVIDFASANFVEPPGVGALLASQLDGIAVLIAATEDTDLPDMHLIIAVGEESGGNVEQEPCTETTLATAGPDRLIGTSDDVPADFTNPGIAFGPTDLSLNVTLAGVPFDSPLTDVVATSTFHPDLDDLRGGTVQARMDTRPLAPLVDPEGDEDALCKLIEATIGTGCVECGGDNPGVFCLVLRAEEVVSEYLPSFTIQPITCVDIIAAYEGTGECDSEAQDYDADGNGSYELCPAW